MPKGFDDVAGTVREVYMNEDPYKRYCTFPFLPDLMVRLDDNFMDHLDDSIRKIRATLKDADAGVRRNGEGLIGFMEEIMSE